jgi:hypothetical protein
LRVIEDQIAGHTQMAGALVPTLESVIHKSLDSAGLKEPAFVRILQRIFPGLATLQRLTKDFPEGSNISIEIDRDDVTRDFGSTTVNVDGRRIELSRVAKATYESHRKRLFPRSSALATSGIAVVRSRRPPTSPPSHTL